MKGYAYKFYLVNRIFCSILGEFLLTIGGVLYMRRIPHVFSAIEPIGPTVPKKNFHIFVGRPGEKLKAKDSQDQSIIDSSEPHPPVIAKPEIADFDRIANNIKKTGTVKEG